MFALIICLNIGSKSTEKPNAPFMCVSLAAVVNCVCVSASMRSRVAASECECVQIKTKPCGTKCAHGDQRHTEQFRIFLLTIACNSDVKNRISLSTIFLFLLQVFFGGAMRCTRSPNEMRIIVDFHMKFDIINGINRLNIHIFRSDGWPCAICTKQLLANAAFVQTNTELCLQWL